LPRLRWPSLRGLRLAGLSRFHYRPLVVSRRSSNLLRWLTWAYLVVAIIYAAVLWLGGDAWWVATVLLFVPRWPILLPAPLLAIAAVLIRPRLLLPLVLAVLVSVGPAMGYRLGVRGWFIGSTHADLRIATFNLDAGENPRLYLAPAGLDKYYPDVVAFEECDAGVANPNNWPPGWTTRFDSGICPGSKFPVVEARTLERVQTGEQGGTGTAMFYRLKVPSGTIDLAVIHLETPRKGLEQLTGSGGAASVELSDLVRQVGSRRISRWVREQSKELIVVGDFNMPVESTIYRAFWSDCDNSFSSVGHGFGWTRFLKHFSIRIDHILSCGGGWRPLRAVVGPDLGSDHLPLIVDLARRVTK
jgi:vancomycin resistance protein VanJ